MSYDFSLALRNPCNIKKGFCVNCNSYFLRARPYIKSVILTKHFIKDLRNQEATSIVNDVLDCSNVEFTELHKFEEHVDGNMVFRAKKKGMHIVYCIDRNMRLIFLRIFRNFKEYQRFLGNKKEIHNLILHN